MTVEAVAAVRDYVSPVSLFDSGAEAALHGLSGLDRPGLDTLAAVEKIRRRRGDVL